MLTHELLIEKTFTRDNVKLLVKVINNNHGVMCLQTKTGLVLFYDHKKRTVSSIARKIKCERATLIPMEV